WMEYAVKSAPKDAKAHLGFASWLLEQNRPGPAQAQLEVAAQLSPDSIEVRGLRGLIAHHLKRYEEVERIFQALALEAPGSFAVSNQLALALAEQSAPAKRRRALQLAELNARLYPHSSEALATLGIVLYRQERLTEAEQALRTALAN